MPYIFAQITCTCTQARNVPYFQLERRQTLSIAFSWVHVQDLDGHLSVPLSAMNGRELTASDRLLQL